MTVQQDSIDCINLFGHNGLRLVRTRIDRVMLRSYNLERKPKSQMIPFEKELGDGGEEEPPFNGKKPPAGNTQRGAIICPSD